MHSLNRLRLVNSDEQGISPAGMIVTGEALTSLAFRLITRREYYKGVRVTSFRDHIIFWSIEKDVHLPWVETPDVYLTQVGKSLFFPMGKKPDLPEQWMDKIVNRFVMSKGISRPVLLLPLGEQVAAIGLGSNSYPASVIDWKQFMEGQ